ncbi:RYR2 protein, partial [Polypterus senegalus]
MKKYIMSTAFIPGGCTKYVQPADVVWNKPLKDKLQELYDNWMAGEEDKAFTADGNLKAPALRLLVIWIISAWQEITPEMIRKSIKDCGIINACDGTEDHLIHCFKEGQPCHAGSAKLITARQQAMGVPVLPSQEEEDEEELANNEAIITYSYVEGEDGEKREKPKVEKPSQKVRKRHSQKSDEIEIQESAFLKKIIAYQRKLLNYFARNFYNMRMLALFVAFAINFILLFYKVPLVIFKREKEVARKLEFDGLYITEQPSEDDIKGQWDRLVINTQSFPNNYWDKFVKRKVMDKYGEFYGRDRISELLGMDKAALDFSDAQEKKKPKKDSSLSAVLNSIDVKYQIWKLGVVFTDNSFLYLAWYMTMSILGHYNNFFFAAHLLDIAMGFKTLRTILSSVTHNGKQLVLTVGLLAVVVYLYTVVAFNFFRKFYNKSEDGDTPDMKCDDMLTCYMFHMYVGVRAGGGIGDEIEDPAGDEYEIYRIIFDITFFFFVIVILLAIIQGLIIDAFGELRDQQEQVKEDMEVCQSEREGKQVDNQPQHYSWQQRWGQVGEKLGYWSLRQLSEQ